MAKAEAEYSASAATVDSERVNRKVVNQWISTLRGDEMNHSHRLCPGHRKRSNEGQVACDGCANTPDVYFEGYERWKKGRQKPEALKLCEKRYKKRRRKAYLKAWDPETNPQRWKFLPRDAVLLDHSTRMQLRVAQRRQKSGQTWQQCFKAFCQRLPKVSFNVEFFTHRMESDNSAKFAAEHAERFIATPAEEPSRLVLNVLMRDEDFPRCLVAHRRRCKKRLQENPKSGLQGVMPSAFFTHRLSDARATFFLQKFACILSVPNGAKDHDDRGDRGDRGDCGDRGPEMTPEPDR